MSPDYSRDEMMTITAARTLRDGMTCFVGIGLPSEAANLARATHAPGLVLIYESGTIGAKPGALPLSIGDGILAQTADAVVSVPEIFNYWIQPGRIDLGFLGAAQIDKFGNINTTVIGGLRQAQGAAARRRRRPRDRRVVPGGDRGAAAEPPGVRGAGRLRHLGRIRRRARRPRSASA